MMQQFDSLVVRLQRQQGVVGVMLVGIEDGMVIAGDAGQGRKELRHCRGARRLVVQTNDEGGIRRRAR